MPGVGRITTVGSHPGQGGVMVGLSIDVRGIPEVQKALERCTGPEMKRTLQKASTAGAKALKKPVQAAAPRGATGRLRKSVSSRQARRDRPAAVVTARPKVAFYRHMVIGGTRAHGPRKSANKMLVFKGEGGRRIVTPWVKGTSARPFIAVGFERGKGAAERAIEKVIDDYLATI